MNYIGECVGYLKTIIQTGLHDQEKNKLFLKQFSLFRVKSKGS